MLIAKKNGNKTVPGTSGISSFAMVWSVDMPYAIVGVFSWIRYPRTAIIPTRPCRISASRRRLTPVSSLPFENPRGSKKPRGAEIPGRPWQGSDSSGVQPLRVGYLGATSSSSVTAVAVASSVDIRSNDDVVAPLLSLLAEGAKAQAALMDTDKRASFMVET